jgi:pyruvate dehydrogenase (quinone)
MGSAVPYAIAAKFAYPGRPVIAIAGDGAMQMNGMAELITIGKYYPRWADPRLIVMVLNNGDLNQVTWEQRAMAGDPKFSASQDVPHVSFAGFAELIGLRGISVDVPDAIGPAWDAALQSDRPCVVDLRTDPDVPPLVPNVTMKQMRAYTEALLKGDPDTVDIVKATLKQVFA